MVMVCYGVLDPPKPPYILILMASIQGIAFNMLWVGADYCDDDAGFYRTQVYLGGPIYGSGCPDVCPVSNTLRLY